MKEFLEVALDVAVALVALAIGATMVRVQVGNSEPTLSRTPSPALHFCAAALIFIIGTCIGATSLRH
jgi:hypothetical protein